MLSLGSTRPNDRTFKLLAAAATALLLAALPLLLRLGAGPALLTIGLLAPWPALLALKLQRNAAHRRRQQDELQRLAAENVGLRHRCEQTARRCQHLLDNAGDAIFFIDPKSGALLEMNRRAEELLGYAADEIRTLSPTVLFPARQHRRYLRLVKQVLSSGYGEEDDLLFRRKDGKLFPGAVHARLGELGDAQVVHGVLRDVSEIKRIERELRQKNQDLTLVNEIARHVSGGRLLPEMLQSLLARLIPAFAATGGGIYLLGDDGSSLSLAAHQGIDEPVLAEIARISAGTGLAGRVAATGQPRSSVDLQRDRRLRSQAVRNAGWRGFQAIPLTTKEKTTGVVFLFRQVKHLPRREEVNLLLAIGQLVGTAVEREQLFEALQWQHRLTQVSNRELIQSRRQLEENLARLEDANQELERVDRMKSNFLALASHELRTPLTCVIAGTDLLAANLAESLDKEDRQALEAVREGGRRLENLVHDLLEAARIESQSIYLAREPVDLPTILEEIGHEFRPVFAERRLAYRVDRLPDSLELHGDPHHLKQTFRRLLENAVKFTPEGGAIEIAAALRSAAELKSREADLRPFSASFFRNTAVGRLLQVTVRDSGVGIDPEEQVRVFDKFYEIGDITGHFSSRTRFGGKGVGLGLTLVKGMVEAHGGMVWVESPGTGEDAGGSAFHILLPLAPATAEAINATR